ncbi:hypothetical protein BD410DRAFT_789822 [Rickenella mellea]|uniref:DUF6534 domain-containing protein n=1 Tax=Rickenella mellea TaxID=50990 RepID=A0A4Y7Q172_9AGAM|nr:hypothetical protein BD410DRAFT_789822 [Rickenella mellea]
MASPMGATFGAGFIAQFISSVIYGMTLLQAYRYFKHYPKDQLRLKLFVLALCLADMVHVILCTWSFHWYLVANFGNYGNLTIPHWTMNIQTDANGLIAISVQLYNARRVHKLVNNKAVTAVVVLLSLILGILFIYFSVETFILDDFLLYSKLRWVICTGLGCAAAANIIIATSFCCFFRRNRTGMLQSDTVLTMLTFYSINTGLLTSIAATLSLITFAAMPSNFVWLIFFWVLGRFYVNSLLATLNSREVLREMICAACNCLSPSVHMTTLRVERTPSLPHHWPRVPISSQFANDCGCRTHQHDDGITYIVR